MRRVACNRSTVCKPLLPPVTRCGTFGHNRLNLVEMLLQSTLLHRTQFDTFSRALVKLSFTLTRRNNQETRFHFTFISTQGISLCSSHLLLAGAICPTRPRAMGPEREPKLDTYESSTNLLADVSSQWSSLWWMPLDFWATQSTAFSVRQTPISSSPMRPISPSKSSIISRLSWRSCTSSRIPVLEAPLSQIATLANAKPRKTSWNSVSTSQLRRLPTTFSSAQVRKQSGPY